MEKRTHKKTTVSYLYIAQASACDEEIIADLQFSSEISFVHVFQEAGG